MMEQSIPKGKHLFLNFQGKSRTSRAASVSVLLRDPDAQPGQQMKNVSQYAAKILRRPFNPRWNAVVINQRAVTLERDELARFLCGELGKKLHQDAQAFTWEWL